jgi:hypothetical protein
MFVAVLGIAVLYIVVEALAFPLLVGVVLWAVPEAIVVGVLVTLIGIRSLWISFPKAQRLRDVRWMADHFLAPMLGMFSAIFFYRVILLGSDIPADVSAWVSTGGPLIDSHGTLLLVLLDILILFIAGLVFLLIAAVAIIAILVSPFAAATRLDSVRPAVRFWSYVAFVVCGCYWGMIAVHVLLHKHIPLN